MRHRLFTMRCSFLEEKRALRRSSLFRQWWTSLKRPMFTSSRSRLQAKAFNFLAKAEVPMSSDEGKVSSAQGVVTTASRDASVLAKAFIQAIAAHRHFDRRVE